MAQQVVILFVTLLAIINAKLPSPRALQDEVMNEVDSLNSMVQGEILAAHDNLGNMQSDHGTNSVNVVQSGRISIEQGHQEIFDQVAAIKELANVANIDYLPCTNNREQRLNDMPLEFANLIGACITVIDQQAFGITRDATYTVDVTINKVDGLRFRVVQCGESMLCLSPLMTEIELDKVRLPQNVKTQVQATGTLLKLLQVSVQGCSDDNISEYVAQSYELVAEITDCVNRILG